MKSNQPKDVPQDIPGLAKYLPARPTKKYCRWCKRELYGGEIAYGVCDICDQT